MRRSFRLAAGLLLALTAGAQEPAPVVGSLVDRSGPTAVLGEAYARGVQARVDSLNREGGVGGKPLGLVQIDCGDDPARAIEAYRDLLGTEGLVAILGWGSRDTDPLAAQVRADRIPFFLSAAPARYSDPTRHPYHFPTVPSYTTLLRAGLTHLRGGWEAAAPPRLALLFPPTPFGRGPVAEGKAHAKELGFEVVAEVELTPGGEADALAGLLAQTPDFVWCGGTAAETAALITRGRELGLQARFLCNLWAAEGLVELAGGAAEGALAVGPTARPGDGGEGLDGIARALGGESPSPSLVRGWVAMEVVAGALSRAGPADALSGDGVKAAAEGLRELPTGGLSAPVSYTAADHRPHLTARIHRVQDGRWVPVGLVTLDRDTPKPGNTPLPKAPDGPGEGETPAPAANSEGG